MAKHGRAKKNRQKAKKVIKIMIEFLNKKETIIGLILASDYLEDGQIDGFGLSQIQMILQL